MISVVKISFTALLTVAVFHNSACLFSDGIEPGIREILTIQQTVVFHVQNLSNVVLKRMMERIDTSGVAITPPLEKPCPIFLHKAKFKG